VASEAHTARQATTTIPKDFVMASDVVVRIGETAEQEPRRLESEETPWSCREIGE
jgi:hypothetical protein